jgi:hypothetical protein
MYWRMLLVACLTLAAGCASRGSVWRGAAPVGPSLDPELVPAGQISADVSQVVLTDDRPPSPAPLYQRLDAPRCQCLAAAHAPLANLLEGEQRIYACQAQRHTHSACAGQLRAQILAYGAHDERNRAAASALRAFYQLAEAEAGRAALADALTEVDLSIDALDQIRGEGLMINIEPGTLRRQRLALVQQQAEVDSTISQLNVRLRSLLGLTGPPAALWPEADLRVTVEPLDPDVEAAEGLAARPDLGALRLLTRCCSLDTLATIRAALAQVSPSLGGALPKAILDVLGGDPCRDAELANRCRQLRMLLTEREQQADAEIRQAVTAVEAALEQIGVAKDLVASWRKRVEQLESMRIDGPPNIPFELRSAKVELFRAESDLIHSVVAWRIARVDLLAAKGVLAGECGFGSQACRACDRRRR